MTLREAVIEYTRQGYAVIPLKPRAKDQPLIKWKPYQTRKPTGAEVTKWWTENPQANIALLTGKISGLVVFDSDGPQAEAVISDNGGVPEGPQSITARGRQYFSKYPGFEIHNNANAKLTLDVRGDGGYVVVPPSIHPSGHVYQWAPGLSLLEVDLPELRPWQLEYLKKHCGGNGQGLTNPPGWQAEALKGVDKGARNDTATKLAGRYVALGLSNNEIATILLTWNQNNSPPLPADEIQTTIQSVRATHERKHPESEAEEATRGPERALIKQVAFRLSDRINLNKQHHKIGEQTGFKFLDRAIYGLVKTFLYIIGAYTSVGKTALLTQLTVNLLKDNPSIRIAVFSTEMAAEHILLRLMANRSAIPSMAIFRGKLDADRQIAVDGAFNYFHNKSIWLFDDVYTFDGIQAKCKAISHLDVVFVDFLQNMQGEGGVYDRMSVLPVQLQRMAKKLNTSVVAMSQVSNEAARGDPRVIGYKGAGELAAACDLGLWLERDKDNEELLQCYIRKNRHGPTGKTTLRYTDNFTRIEEIQ
jgi:hypothetical protein